MRSQENDKARIRQISEAIREHLLKICEQRLSFQFQILCVSSQRLVICLNLKGLTNLQGSDFIL